MSELIDLVDEIIKDKALRSRFHFELDFGKSKFEKEMDKDGIDFKKIRNTIRKDKEGILEEVIEVVKVIEKTEEQKHIETILLEYDLHKKENINMSKNLNYKEYLQSIHWRKFRLEAIKFYRKCVICNSKDRLNVHHKTYENKGNETFNDIIVVCSKCHTMIHKNEN